MEQKEKRPGYFARLKKRRQLKQDQSEGSVNKQDQSESSVNKQDQSDAGQRVPIISDQQEKGLKEEHEKREQNREANKDDGSKPTIQKKEKRRRPSGTVDYTVCPSDTLNSIALNFNITPNELVQLNRLFSRSVVPGQKLFVPDVGQSDSGSQVDGSEPASNPPSRNPPQDAALSLQRNLSPASEDESAATVKFIKMSCKYFTDGMGVVGGVMIVTPNNIMFDPHKSDPLVIEHGCEEYGLICPVDEVISVALYDDVSRMKIKDALPSDLPQDLCPLYRPGEWAELPSECDLNPFSRYEALERQRRRRPLTTSDPHTPLTTSDPHTHLTTSDPHGPLTTSDPHGPLTLHTSPSDEGFTELEPLGGDGELEPLGGDGELEPLGGDGEGPERQQQQPEEEEERDEGLHTRSSEEISSASRPPSALTALRGGEAGEVATETEAVKDDLDGKTKLTEPLATGGTDPAAEAGDQKEQSGLREAEGDCGTCSSPQEEQEAELTEEQRRRRSSAAEVKSWLLKRIQGPIEDMLLSTAEKSKAPPMFLCFKVGKPMRKSFAVGQTTTSPAHSFGGRGKLSEYWFAVPQERVDDLYSFLVQWSPEAYGKEELVDDLYSFLVQWSPEAYGKEAREHGFIVVEKDELNMIDNFFSESPRSWEIITINEAKRRQSFGSFEEAESVDQLPCLSDPSALLDDTHIQKLAARLPARVQGYPWRRAYGTEAHGTSLKTLYRNLAELDCPVLLVIKDMDNQVFGAFSTHPFRVSEHCYGTGETFLYSFSPEIKVYRWTGENSYFVKGSLDSLQLGGGGGHLGLWLDADLDHGTTSACSTFNNQPLSTQQDFSVQSLEVWAFE